MKNSSLQTVATTSTLALLLALNGCDRLPEAITGNKAPNTPTIQAVGPSGSRTGEPMAEVSMQMPPMSGDALVNSFAAENRRSGSPIIRGANIGPRAEMVVFEQDGQPIDDSISGFNEASMPGQNYAQIDLPPGDRRMVSAPSYNTDPSEDRNDGVIVIRNANLKFVDDLEISAQADGLIMVLDADEGDQIKAGMELLQLDSRMAIAELDVAIKELDAAIEKSKDDSEIEYSMAADNVAKQEVETSKELVARGGETGQEYRKKWLEARRASLAIKVAQLKNSQDVAAAGVSEAKKRMAQVQVELRSIKAPFDGMVAEKTKDIHDWVRAGDVIMRLVSMDKLRVVGQVRTEQLEAAPHLLLGAPAKVEVELYPGARETLQATVGFVSPVMQSSGSYKVWLEIPNQKAQDQWLFREGMSATIAIDTRP